MLRRVSLCPLIAINCFLITCALHETVTIFFAMYDRYPWNNLHYQSVNERNASHVSNLHIYLNYIVYRVKLFLREKATSAKK